ncbi:MAG: hypothetical protein EA378_03560 [Phycisphaerales bacterium]|nr:MAG: hypothetical protein EA378_03560 [Phycisphaerales bacterium]
MRRFCPILIVGAAFVVAGGWPDGVARAQDFDEEPDERPSERFEPAAAERPQLPLGLASRPGAANRLVRLFDFDERATNPTDLPEAWFRAQHDPPHRERPGFPIYNLARLTPTGDEARGDAVLMRTRGGSAALRLRPGVIPVFPNADYRISALVRTEALDHARARLAARFLDADNTPIPGSEARSVLVDSRGEWSRVYIDLRGDDEGAAFIQIDLELLQPAQFARSLLGPREIWPQDYDGAAWFDDVAVVQLPRIELATTSPGNVVTSDETPELTLLVRDLTGEALAIAVRVLDIDGVEIDRWSTRIAGGRAATSWQPRLERLGWYRAVVEVEAGGRRVGSSYCDFVWTPAPSPVTAPRRRTRDLAGVDANAERERNRFGVDLAELPEGVIAELPMLTRRLGVGSVLLPVWGGWAEGRTVAEQLALLEPMLESLLGDWLNVTIALTRLPPPIIERQRVEPEGVLRQFADDGAALTPYLDPLLDRYGQRIGRWQIGRSGSARADAMGGDLARAVAEAHARLAALVPGPTVSIGWPAELSLDPFTRARNTRQTPPTSPAREHSPAATPTAGVGAVSMVWPDAFPAQGVGDAVARFRESGVTGERAELTLVLEPTDADQLGPRRAAATFAQRIIQAWKAVAPTPPGAPPARLAIPAPWAWVEARRPQPMPTPEYALWRNMVERLAYRRVVGELPLVPGVECWILAPTPNAPLGRGGALVVWTNHLPADNAAFELFLGHADVRAYDIFGNARDLRPRMITEADEPDLPPRPVHLVQATAEPLFLEGVDVPLLRFLAGFRLEPPLLPAASELHQRDIVLSNPWPAPMSGSWSLIQPGGRPAPNRPPDRSWDVNPRRMGFALAPGEDASVPMTIVLSPAQEAGPLPFTFEFDLLAGSVQYPRMRLDVPVEVGLDTLELLLSYRPIPTQVGPDVLVEATVTNLGDEPAVLEVVAFAPGFPQQRATIPDLPPGERTVVRFQYPGGAATLRGQRVAVRVSDLDSNARLNKSIPVH